MDEKEFFDHLAPTWDDNEVLSTPDKVRFVLGFMNLKPGQSVLDLGTGTGVLLPYIAEKIGTAGHITAVDYSAGMLSRAKKNSLDSLRLPNFSKWILNRTTYRVNMTGLFCIAYIRIFMNLSRRYDGFIKCR